MPIDAGRALLPWLVFAALALGGCGRAVYHDPLHDVIATADRIVVRDGGFNGPKPNDRQKVLFQVTDPAKVRALIDNLKFLPKPTGPSCTCWGYPGIDWYRGSERLAVTSVQHCRAIRWKGFPTDASLTKESAAWLKQWLLDHGIKEEKLTLTTL